MLAAVLASSVLNALSVAPTTSGGNVAWVDVRIAIGESICSVSAERAGRTFVLVSTGERAPCGTPAASTALGRAADAAWLAAGPVLVNLSVGGTPIEVEETDDHDLAARTAKAREDFLSDPDFLRSFLPRLRKSLAAEGLTCGDCPTPPALAERRVTWDEFSRYLQAYVWPDAVRTPVGPDGKPAGRPKTSFHVCSGLNGVAELENADPQLTQAAFLAVWNAQPIRELAGQAMMAALGSAEYQALADDAARTAHLRKTVPAETFARTEARQAICEALAGIYDDVAIRVAECGDAGAEPAAHR
jgi:hypothetical protein